MQSWVAVLGLLATIVFGALPLWLEGKDDGDRDEFTVLKLSAGQSREIDTRKTDEATGRRFTSKERATVLYLYLSNNTDDLKVFQGLKVTTRRFIQVTDCTVDVGGSVQITEGYDIDLPRPGKSTHKSILYQLPPRQAEGISITLGTSTQETGVFDLEVSLQSRTGYLSAGRVIALSHPELKRLYPRDLEKLPLQDFPNASCVRRLDQTLSDFISQHDSVPPEVRTLQEGVHTTAEQLG